MVPILLSIFISRNTYKGRSLKLNIFVPCNTLLSRRSFESIIELKVGEARSYKWQDKTFIKVGDGSGSPALNCKPSSSHLLLDLLLPSITFRSSFQQRIHGQLFVNLRYKNIYPAQESSTDRPLENMSPSKMFIIF